MSDIVARFVRLASGRLLWFNVLVLIAAKLLLPAGSGGLAAVSDPLRDIDLTAVMQGTNDARQTASLRPLERNTTLDAAAARKLADMAAKAYFAHVGPDGTQAWDFISQVGYRYTVAGENLGRGFYDGSALVQAWMGSPSHRANVMSPNYRHIGLAAGRVMVNGKSTLVVVQLFGTPAVAPVAKPATPTPSPVVTAPKPAIEPLAVSTDKAIPQVVAPKTMSMPMHTASARISGSVTSTLAVELAMVLGLLTLAIAWMGAHKGLVRAWAGNAAVLALVAVVPTLTSIPTGTIL